MCICCSQHLFNTTAYWCSYCCNYLIYPELCKPSGEYHDELDGYIKSLMEPAAPNGILPRIICVAALPPNTIDKLCELGASRNNYFDEEVVQCMAVDIKTRKIPAI